VVELGLGRAASSVTLWCARVLIVGGPRWLSPAGR
jgi:hypothetical protein